MIRDETKRDEILSLRGQGLTLQQIGDKFGLSRERVRQLIASTDVKLCRYCKLPKALVPGRRRCRDCYVELMASRPSKKAKRTGYRKDARRHRGAAFVRLAKMNLSIPEIAERMGLAISDVKSRLSRLRKAGKEVRIRYLRRKENL